MLQSLTVGSEFWISKNGKDYILCLEKLYFENDHCD